MPYNSHHGLNLTRRQWLAGLAVLGFGQSARADDDETGATDPPGEPQIRALAKRVKLPEFRVARTEHYFGLGDAPAAFTTEALNLCEKLATTYQQHFKEKGFATALPRERMTVVVLSGRKAYSAFEEEDVGDDEGGHYDVDTNRLVMFDFLKDAKRGGARAAQVNTFSLVHEATHQLTYSTGLLNRAGDVPVAISEGFATYCETWQRRAPNVGLFNRARAQSLPNPNGDDWITVDRLLSDDTLFEPDAETCQAAYAEAWLLIHTLMNARAGAFKGTLETYLDTIRPRTDESKRVADAEKTFGDLKRLDKELKRAALSRARG